MRHRSLSRIGIMVDPHCIGATTFGSADEDEHIRTTGALDTGPVGAAYEPPAVLDAALRRRPTAERNAA